MSTLRVNFLDADYARQALSALVDRGACQADLSACFPRGYFAGVDPTVIRFRRTSKGMAITAQSESAALARIGAAVGLGLGVLTISLGGAGFIAALATAAGALLGWIWGVLSDRRIDAERAEDPAGDWRHTKASLAIACPTGSVNEFQARAVLSKFCAIDRSQVAQGGSE